jgi:hypothetical protein
MTFFSENEDFVRETKIVPREKKIQWKCNKLEESDNTSNAGATRWLKENKTPNLGPFTGSLGVKLILSDPTKVWWIIELFVGDNFEMLCKETNLYYFQNQGKYDSNYKVMKCVGVSVVHATHKKRSETRYICKFCVAPLHKEECFERYHSLRHY